MCRNYALSVLLCYEMIQCGVSSVTLDSHKLICCSHVIVFMDYQYSL